MLRVFRAKLPYMGVFLANEHAHDAIDIQRVMLAQAPVWIVHPIAKSAQLHQQVRKSLWDQDLSAVFYTR